MIELVFAACLIAEPAKCREVSLVFAESTVTELQCSIGPGGQVAVAQWLAAHPRYFAKRRMCRRAGTFARI